MSFDPYCRLYLHTSADQSELFANCKQYLDGEVSGFCIETSLFVFYLQANDDYDEDRFSKEKRFVFARYTAEIEGPESGVDEEVFIRKICQLIVELREKDIQVAAACGFEDQIAEQIGCS